MGQPAIVRKDKLRINDVPSRMEADEVGAPESGAVCVKDCGSRDESFI